MEDLIISTLESIGFPVFLQGSLLSVDDYPDDFFTFWNDNSEGKFYGDDEKFTTYEYSVNFYSTDPANVYNKLRDAMTALKLAGFIIAGDGYSVPSGKNTHDGRGITVRYLKTNRKD